MVFVTGTIGDGLLGLQAARGQLTLDPERLAFLIDHYRQPTPQQDFAEVIAAHATAAADVSDGLIADLKHIAGASGVAIDLKLDSLPLSAAARAWFEARVDPQAALEDLATGGDDYQIVFTAPARLVETLRREADRRRVRLTLLGEVRVGAGVTVSYGGRPLTPGRAGWTHG
jgi:thiamine-monophosphate kinase